MEATTCEFMTVRNLLKVRSHFIRSDRLLTWQGFFPHPVFRYSAWRSPGSQPADRRCLLQATFFSPTRNQTLYGYLPSGGWTAAPSGGRMRGMPRRSRCVLPPVPCHVSQPGAGPGGRGRPQDPVAQGGAGCEVLQRLLDQVASPDRTLVKGQHQRRHARD